MPMLAAPNPRKNDRLSWPLEMVEPLVITENFQMNVLRKSKSGPIYHRASNKVNTMRTLWFDTPRTANNYPYFQMVILYSPTKLLIWKRAHYDAPARRFYAARSATARNAAVAARIVRSMASAS